MIRRSRAALAALLVLSLSLAACGEKKDNLSAKPRLEKVTLLLDFFPNADHAPIYAAVARGDFKKAGIDLQIKTPSDASTPLKLLAAGKADIVITYEPDLLIARDKGLPLMGVGALVQRPLTSIISLPAANIKKPADLSGKKVATAGIAYQKAFLDTILDRVSVPDSSVKQFSVGFNLVPDLLSKKVDAILGGFWNYEGVQLAQLKKDPQIIRVDQAGVPTYDELVFATTEQTVKKRGELIRRFMQAMQSGARAVQADPEAGVIPLLAANKDLKRPLQLASVKATLSSFFPTRKGRAYGYMEPSEWEKFGDWMNTHKLLTTPSNSAAFTNEFLPGEGGQASERTPGDDADQP